MLRLAGYSSGRSVGARGGWAAGRGRFCCGEEEPLLLALRAVAAGKPLRLRFAQPPPLSEEAFGALADTTASPERGGVAAGDGGVVPVRHLWRKKKAQRRLTSQAAPCYNVGMKG